MLKQDLNPPSVIKFSKIRELLEIVMKTFLLCIDLKNVVKMEEIVEFRKHIKERREFC